MFESRKNNRDSRFDFERDLRVLEENIKKKKNSFSPHIKKHVRDLLKVRGAPNSRINLDTISEIVRSLAMSSNF